MVGSARAGPWARRAGRHVECVLAVERRHGQRAAEGEQQPHDEVFPEEQAVVGEHAVIESAIGSHDVVDAEEGLGEVEQRRQ